MNCRSAKETARVVSFSCFVLCVVISLSVLSSHAGEADVQDVQVRNDGDNRYAFSVSVLHADSGWDHYADKWDVVGKNGEVYGTRKLLHPHVDEQPFTRSLSGVVIPAGVKSVTIRAHDSVDGYGGETVLVELPSP